MWICPRHWAAHQTCMFWYSCCLLKPLFYWKSTVKWHIDTPDYHLFYKMKPFEAWCLYIKFLYKLGYILAQQRIYLEKDQKSPKGVIHRILIWSWFEIFGYFFHELINPQIQLILLQNTSQHNLPRQQS